MEAATLWVGMAGMGASERMPGLVERSAGTVRSAYRTTTAVAFVYAVVALAILTVADRPGPLIPGISAFFAAGVFATELATAFLLFVRVRESRAWSLLLLACAYLYSSLMAPAYLLTFPGALLRDGSVVGTSQSVAWIFILWIFGFALLSGMAVASEAACGRRVRGDVAAVTMIAAIAVIAAVAVIAVVAVVAVDRLPLLVGPQGWTALDKVLSVVNMAMLLAGVLVILLAIRGRDEIFLWAALALTAMLVGNVLSTYGGGRFTLGWSFSRLSWVFSGCVLFLYFMGEFVRQQRLLGSARDALERRVTERTADLTSMIGQRDLLLREVHHRVKNNLQAINSLINFQASHAASEETREALRNLHGRIYALGLVHQRLMQSSNLATFDIRDFLADLCGNLASLSAADARGIALSAEADPLQTDLDFAGPLGLLVTELVTAALARYDDGRSGAIRVAVRRSGAGSLALTVADDAPPAAADASGSARIVHGLVRQLRGELTVAAAAGTTVTVQLPAATP